MNRLFSSRYLCVSVLAALMLMLMLPRMTDAAEKKTKSTAVPKTVAIKAPESAEDIAPANWIGRQFVLLEMPPQYRRFGYELYLSEKRALQTGPVDTVQTLQNRRIRYDVFRGKLISARSAVKADSGEYVVTFAVDSTATVLYAKTRSQAIKGIAPLDDITRARSRWVGKTVFSRRGFISSTDSTAAVIATHQVTVQTPLKVTAVRPGVSPLPTQTIWIMVETPDRKTGFIPTYLTWTNVMVSSRKECRPWQDDLLENDPRRQFQWDNATWDAVNAHTVFTDMNRDQVLLSWGYPQGRDSVDLSGTRVERWTYQSQYLYLAGNLVHSIVNR